MPDVSMSAQSKDRTTDNDTRFVTSDSSRNEDGSDIATVAGGYEHGNFASGRRFDIPLLDRSFCMAYSSPFNFHCNGCARQSTATRAPATPALLAVGTASSLDFYDCQVSGSGSSVYPLVYSLPTTSMISALEWVNDNNYFDEAAAISKEKRLKRRYQKNRIFEQRNETLHDIERQTTWLPTPVTKKRDRPFSTPRRPIVHTQPTGSCRCCCSDNGNVLLLVTATLTGLVSLYNLDRDILESQGPTLLWVRAVHGNAQIRSLAIVVCGFQAAEDNTDEDGIFFDDGDAEITTVQSSTSTSTSSSPSLSHQPDSRRNDGDLVLLVATGDKNGSFIISALQMNVSSSLPFCQVVFLDSIPMFPSHLATQPCCSGAATNRMSGILGLTVQTELGLLAMSTTGGLVQVFTLESLVKIYSTSFRFRNRQSAKAATDVHQDLLQISIVWSMQNNGGAIRAVAFSAASDHLFAYGGYDKKVVLVDTLQWDVSRELHVQGTVSEPVPLLCRFDILQNLLDQTLH